MTLNDTHIAAIRTAYRRSTALADYHQNRPGPIHARIYGRAQGQAEAYLSILDIVDRDDTHMLAVAGVGRIDAAALA